MNTRPFDLEAAKRGEAICRKNGEAMTFIAHVPAAIPNQRVLVLDVAGQVWTCQEDGLAISTGFGKSLHMVVKTKTVWVNLYEMSGRVTTVGPDFLSEKEAIAYAGSAVLRTVSVEIPS